LTQKVAIVTDSISCLTRELTAQYGIGIIPVNFYACGKLYKDWVDITISEAYELFLKEPDSFKSSAASPADCLECFRKAGETGESIICVTVSAKLSATYSSAVDAKELAETELPGVAIEVIDSFSATPSEGFVALAAARAAAEGKNLAEATAAAEKIRDRVNALLFLETIQHVYRSGRIPKIASRIGSALNIKPLLSIHEGLVHFNSVVRNRRQGIERILQIMRDKSGEKPVHVAVTHAYAPDEAERLRERIAAEFNCAELWIAEFSPVMGYACGTGTVGAAFYTDD
jgi:DegV family protein with EDD domain